uniref:Uncharacterized protein n=1 Tax=Heterorhabditis bacteriophora TaxID=37862 RepID=A0A1I7XAY2_HETBA
MKIEHNDGFHINKDQHAETIHGAATEYKEADHIDHKKLYTELFKGKRREQLTAVESIVNIDATKQRQLIEEIVRNIRNILEESRDTIEKVGHSADAPFPHDSGVLRDALSKVFSWYRFISLYVLSLYFDLTLSGMRNTIFRYINPFDKTRTKEDIEKEALEEQRKRKEKKERELKLSKKQKKSGPKMSKTEL